MTKSRQSADFAAGGPSVAGKNGVINGAFDIWQRGTTSATTAFAYTADRWLKNSATHYGASRQVTGDTTNLPTVQYCARVQRTASSAVTTLIEFTTPFETTNSIPFAGQTVVYSFYARRGANYSSTSNVLSSSVYTGTGTDQTVFGYTGLTQAITGNATLTTTWQRFSYTGTLSAAATEISVYFAYTPTGTAGANDYFEVTGVQLEIGSVATTFTRTGGTIQGELANCQRYYFRNNFDGSSNYAIFGQGAGNSTTQSRTIVNFPVPLRVKPTAIDYPTLTKFTVIAFDDSINVNPNSLTFDTNQSNSQLGYLLWGTASAGVANRPLVVRGSNDSTAYLGWTAEL